MAARRGIDLGDLLLPLIVVSVVGMMIFPLPLAMLDILLMFNIAFSLSLLVSSVYLSEPERFTALPTVLLLSTLFRLSLNISTTRQLLAHGEAPEIVAAFGHFVIGGNVLVGVVVFLILTLVQFLVIAKGAERVAEVAARFTLDAMPGKQMAIDADVRAGLLTLAEARERRRDLQRESKLYGALDGAMKFVKGDAIAALVITVINICAGLYVGVSQLGLSFAEAAHRFTVFTVGDGLVSQIPALLVAVAAGICVTRVSDKEGTFIGREVFAQLGQDPRATVTTAVILVALSMAPGLPLAPFLTLAFVMFVFARRRQRVCIEIERRAGEGVFRPRVFSPLALLLSPAATAVLQAERELPDLLRRMRSDIFDRWGVLVPDVQFELDAGVEETRARLSIKGVSIGEVVFSPTSAADRMSPAVLQMVANALERDLVQLMDDGQTRALFDVHHPVAEDLINSVIPSVVSVTGLSLVLRKLIEERVPVRELRTILQAIAECGLEGETLDLSIPREQLEQGRKQLPQMLAAVRIALRRVISKSVTAADRRLTAAVISPDVDQLLARVAVGGVPLSPELSERLVARCREAEEKTKVILTGCTARPQLAALLGEAKSNFRVLAYEELSEEVELEICETIGFDLPDADSEKVVSLRRAA